MSGKILIVDDNEKSRILLRDILQFQGFEVWEAGNGEEGIGKAGEIVPDLILMDIQMPKMDGFATLKVLRDNPSMRSIRVIAVTSLAMAGDREKILAAGFDDYVAKPIDTRELPRLIKKLLT